jgi:transcriptional regulator with XRE-family HTH domain
VTSNRSPTLRRRELASRLRGLRSTAGLTTDQVASQMLCSGAKISRIETGSRPASLRDVRDLCGIYKVGDAQREQLMNLAREATQQGWWHKYDDLAIDTLIGLEVEAIRITSYESCIIPWAYQTREYAQAVLRGMLPRIADRVLDERVAARLTRQELLTREYPPHFWSLIDESALYRVVGSRAVMYEQLGRVVELANEPAITMQVVPYEIGAHPGLDNTFSLLEFDDPDQPPVLYIENMAGNIYLERQKDIDRYKEAIEHIRAGALSPASSKNLVVNVMERFRAPEPD